VSLISFGTLARRSASLTGPLGRSLQQGRTSGTGAHLHQSGHPIASRAKSVHLGCNYATGSIEVILVNLREAEEALEALGRGRLHLELV
jgi:hypothetical protein